MIVAVLFALLPSGAALAGPIGVPEFGTAPKVVKKKVRRYFRPAMPVRNPIRPVSEAAESYGEAATMAEGQADEPIVVTNLLPPPDPFEAVETKSAEALAPETEQASDTDDPEEPDDATEEASNEPVEQPTVAEQQADMEQPIVVTDLSPPEDPFDAVEAVSAEALAPETEQTSEPEEAEQADETTEVIEAPSHDATVVIEVLPPDDATAEETAASEADVEVSSDDAPEATSSDDETETLVETIPEVVEPPAHPVVAAIRVTLADPSFRKSVRPGAVKALESFYETREDAPVWITDTGFSTSAQAIIGEIGKAGDWGLDARAFDLPNAEDRPSTPEEQAATELKLDMAILKYARFAQGGRLTPSRVSKLFDQRPSLRDPKTVLTDLAAAEAPSDTLTSLHPPHEQFKRLQAALVKARASNNTRDTQHIAINMERWRWMPRQLGSLHVWNNVPEFNTRVMKNGKNIYEERTIVGQLKYATPFFSASMRNIVVHPDWTLPPTILKEDIAPNLQKPKTFFGQSNTAILRHHKIRVSYEGKTIDPDKVDWTKVNIHRYTFTQPSGPANVLGKFKFNFPNKHAIYMHDTPQRGLFSERVRTFSHGCIRVNQPSRLAILLLSEDKGWTARQVDDLVARGENKAIALRRPVPVHLTYFTLTVGDDGRLQTFADIYGLDGRMAPKLFDRPVKFKAPAAPVIAEANARNQGRSGRQSGGGLGGLVSGLFGN